MAALTIGGIDLSSLGFNFTDEGHALDAAVEMPLEMEMPGLPGAIVLSPYRVPVREFLFKGYLDGASQSAVRTNLHKLQALLGDGRENALTVGDWPTVQILAACVQLPGLNYPVQSRANSQNEIPFAVEMRFRASNPYWQDITPQAITFNTSHTDMPQGTAESYPVLTSPVGVLAACTLTGYDYLNTQIWTATLEALTSGQQYRITVAPAVMTIEKFVSGAWTNSDASLTAGRFPMPLPSNGVGYQTAAWPKLAASVGSWLSTYPKQWR